MTLDATGSHDSCGGPLYYFWECSSPTSINCPAFISEYNNPPIQPFAFFVIVELDDFDIQLKVCEARDPSNCSQVIDNHYTGAQL